MREKIHESAPCGSQWASRLACGGTARPSQSNIGIALDTRYSVLAGHLAASDARRVMQLLERLGLPRYHPQLLELDALGQPALLSGLREFQEHLGGALTVTLLAAIGHAVDVHSMDHALIVSAIEWLHTETAQHAAA